MLSNHNQQASSFRIIEPRRYQPPQQPQQQDNLINNSSLYHAPSGNSSSNLNNNANVNISNPSNFVDFVHNRSFHNSNSLNTSGQSSGYFYQQQQQQQQQQQIQQQQQQQNQHHQSHHSIQNQNQQPRLRNLSDTDSSYVPGKLNFILLQKPSSFFICQCNNAFRLFKKII
jgi:hypothetical protein